MPAETHFGRVKFVDRRIGWIERIDGRDLFFHANQVVGNLPIVGTRVSFTIGRNKDGRRRAENVTVQQ